MLGPIFQREIAVLPRRSRHFIARIVFAAALFSLICTAWLLLAGIQPVRNIGDLARFGTLVIQILAPLQLVILMFSAALAGTNSVSHEKDRRTLVLLLLTSLTGPELVLGKIAGGLLPAINVFFAGAPVLMMVTLLGGVSATQAWQCLAITFAAMCVSASLGATIAFWREKTFQALAITLLIMVLWEVVWEAVATGFVPGVSPAIAIVASPLRAILTICQPIARNEWDALPGGLAGLCSGLMLLIAGCLCAISIIFLRVWNPSRQLRMTAAESETEEAQPIDGTAPTTKAWRQRKSRAVWDLPILWREMRTWAYGRKVLLIRLAYIALVVLLGAALRQGIIDGTALERSLLSEELIPFAAKPLAPLFIVSLVIINALAVNSITNERDGQSLDFLLVTEISPAEFIFSKIVGVLYVAKEMVILPLVLIGYLWWNGGITTENMVFTFIGAAVMDVFVAMLGIHCGMIYGQSRTGIAVSLATVFFLFLGVITCMMIMISFRGSFGRQLAPFLAIILGGGTGLYMALGQRNPSPAIALASFGLPFLTFFAITSFILRNQELTVVSVIGVAYAFATAAMLIPALSEFDFAMGRSRTVDE